MKCEFLHKEGSSRLILIFSGWSTDMEFYSHISHPGWDVAVVSGYTDFDFPTEILDRHWTGSIKKKNLPCCARKTCMKDEFDV